MAAVFDLDKARERSDSFDKCCREVERLFREALGGATEGETQSG